MQNLILLVKFKLSNDRTVHVKGAARIKVDGRGSLMLYDCERGIAETIDLRKLHSFSIQPLIGGRL